MNGAVIYAVCAALILAVIKDINPTFSLLGGIFIGIVLICSAVAVFSDFYSSLSDMLSGEVKESLALILKVTGVSICTDVGADICSQLGYQAAGKGIVIYGRISILILALPLVRELLDALHVFS